MMTVTITTRCEPIDLHAEGQLDDFPAHLRLVGSLRRRALRERAEYGMGALVLGAILVGVCLHSHVAGDWSSPYMSDEQSMQTGYMLGVVGLVLLAAGLCLLGLSVLGLFRKVRERRPETALLDFGAAVRRATEAPNPAAFVNVLHALPPFEVLLAKGPGYLPDRQVELAPLDEAWLDNWVQVKRMVRDAIADHVSIEPRTGANVTVERVDERTAQGSVELQLVPNRLQPAETNRGHLPGCVRWRIACRLVAFEDSWLIAGVRPTDPVLDAGQEESQGHQVPVGRP